MQWLKNLFKRDKPTEPRPLKPSIPAEIIQMIPGADQLHQELSDLQKTNNSKKILQRLDELVTAAEANIETISSEVDHFISTENQTRIQIKTADTGSWKERALLLKLERIIIHRKNLQQRIEIFNQNIRVYINMIARIQDISAMQMEGVDEEKIDAIWLDFKEQAEQYKERIVSSDASTKETIILVTQNLEERLTQLRQEIKETPKREPVAPVPVPVKELLIEKKEPLLET